MHIATMLAEVADSCEANAEEIRRILNTVRRSDLREHTPAQAEAVRHADHVLQDMIWQLADAHGISQEV